MSATPLNIVESELRQAPPRPVRLTAAGRRELLYPALAIVALLGLCAWAYFSRRAPGALMPLFVGFICLGLYLLARLLEALHERTLLIREGRATSAIVIEASELRNDRCSYVGWYEVEGKQWAARWTDHEGAAEIGDAVTALYLPGDPGRALIYRTAGCRATSLNAREGLTADHSPLTPRI